MKSFNFHIPTNIIFGEGKINDIGTYIAKEIRNIMIVTDKAVLEKSGAIDKTYEQLKN